MKPITPETFTRYNFVSNPRFSPNGAFVAFLVQHTCLEDNNYPGDLYILETGDNKLRRLTAQGDVKNFTWTSRNTLVFSGMRDPKLKERQKKGEELTAYYEIDPCGGEAVLLFTVPLSAGKLTELGAGRYVFTANFDNARPDFAKIEDEKARDKAMKEYTQPGYHVFEELPYWGNGQGVVNRKRTRLYQYDLSAGKLTPLTAPFFNVGDYEVSDGRIVYTGAEYQDVKPIYSGIYLYESGATRCLLEPGELDLGVVRLFDSEAIVAATDGKKFGEYQMPDFYTICLKTGEMKKLADFGYAVGHGSVGSDARLGGGQGCKIVGDRLYFISTLNDESYLRYVDRSGEISAPLSAYGAADSFDICGDKTVLCGLRGNKLTELYALNADGTETQLTHFNDFVLEEYSVVTPEPFTYTGSDGWEIHGWVMPPVGYVKGQKYPAILHIHGGPKTVFGSVFHNEMQLWANRGYFVLFCNPRGGDGRSHEFADLLGKYGTVDYVNLMEFTDECLKRYPDIDEARMGVAGGSYGGFMTNWIIGHTDRFKAAVAQRSISNWISFEGTTDIGYFFTPGQHGTTTAENPEKLWELSPLKYAHKAKTPTLFIQSDEDYRCYMCDALAMFTALKLHGVESRMCLFHGENHELSRSGKPRNRIKRMEEIVNWMDAHLAPQNR